MKQPFSVFLRGKYYYVAFKNEETGASKSKYLSAISTKKTDQDNAIRQAWVWYKEGVPKKKGIVELKTLSLRDIVKRSEITMQDAELIIEELKRKELVKSCVFSGAPDSVRLTDFLNEIWDYDRSPRIKRKLRAKHSIHRCYAYEMQKVVKKYWIPYFNSMLLGELKTEDIENFIENLYDLKTKRNEPLSSARKNAIIKAGKIALKWAFQKGKIKKDITEGVILFSGGSKERLVLPPKIAADIFTNDWRDERCKIANMLAMVTGLRAGEIQGLQFGDLGDNYIYVRHSWNQVDKLKTTKNNKSRIVEITFPFVVDILKDLAELNPHGCNNNSFVFWSGKSSHKPMEQKLFIKSLQSSLAACGFTDAEKYTFHGWRHFYTTYMRGRLDDKLLQSQTGHLSLEMLEHYSDHRREGDREKIREAQREAFAFLLPQIERESPSIKFEI